MIKQSILIFALCLTCVVHADIGVSPIVVDLAGKEADAEIAVKNFDAKKVAYIEVTAYQLPNPADRFAPKYRVTQPEKDGILVFPAKLILLPSQTQFVRIVKTAKAVSSDHIYEVDFIPKVATHLVSKKNSDGVAMGVRVIVGYGARVTLRPDNPAPAMVIRRVGHQLIIKNTGNTTLNVTSCTQKSAHKKIEIPLPAYTLYAGKTIKKICLDKPRLH